jgi:hypothetical protein
MIWSVKDVIQRGFQWNIGTRENIHVWNHPRLCNANCIFPTTNQHLEWTHIHVSDLLVTHQQQWNIELINGFFDNNTARSKFNTPLLTSVLHDMPTWKFKKDDVYLIKSAYRDIMNHNLEVVQHNVPGNWSCVWKLNLPPKVNNFWWRTCRNCLPTRVRLQTKGVQCPD